MRFGERPPNRAVWPRVFMAVHQTQNQSREPDITPLRVPIGGSDWRLRLAGTMPAALFDETHKYQPNFGEPISVPLDA